MPSLSFNKSNYASRVQSTSAEKQRLSKIKDQNEAQTQLSLEHDALVEEVGESTALTETLEGLSLSFASTLSTDKFAPEIGKASRLRKAFSALIAKQSKSKEMEQLLAPFLDLDPCTAENIKAAFELEEMALGGKVTLLEALVHHPDIKEEEKRRLSDWLDELTQTDAWVLESFAFLSLGETDRATFNQLNLLYQKAIDFQAKEQMSLEKLFNIVASWPDRSIKLNAIMQALGFQLSALPTGDQAIRIAAVLQDLSNLHLFLTVEDQMQQLAAPFGLSEGRLLEQTLQLLDQHWVYPEWIKEQIALLDLAPSMQPAYLHAWKEAIDLLPQACFKDEDQMNQIKEAFAQLAVQSSQ